jgi:membrane protein required for colicin V production
MVETSINIFDAIVIGVIALSAILSLFRGFVRELLSLGAWVGAGIITLYVFPDVAAMIKPHVKSTVVASGFASMGTYIVLLLSISLFNRMLLKMLKPGNEVGATDNILGLVFGVARGILLVSIGYFTMSIMISEDEAKQPDWIKTSLTKPYVEKTTQWLAKLAPEYLSDLSQFNDGKNEDDISEILDDATTKTDEGLLEEDNDATAEPKWPTMEDLQREIESEDNI